jgi:FkbM family methyltransferase
MKIYYGIYNNSIDVTNICIEKLTSNNIIVIPSGDTNRATYFTDPLFGVHKLIIIEHEGNITQYNENIKIKINILDNKITTVIDTNNIDTKINYIHSNLKIKYGNFNEEVPEQKMVVRYLTGNEKILEIGGNIGRNSLIISSLLNNSEQLLVFETNIDDINKLNENKNLNNFNFLIENCAISKVQLFQKIWDTKPIEEIIDIENWVSIKTMTWQEVQNKYNKKFDVLVADCEGALYYILKDEPLFLETFKTIIIENDFHDFNQKIFVDNEFIKFNFKKIYNKGEGWGPCTHFFYEVWKKE